MDNIIRKNYISSEHTVNKVKNQLPLTVLCGDIVDVDEFNHYIMRMFATSHCGTRFIINVRGIRPFVDVKIPDEYHIMDDDAYLVYSSTPVPVNEQKIHSFRNSIISATNKDQKRALSVADYIVTARPLIGYHARPRHYFRFEFASLRDRNNFIKAISDTFITSHDDKNRYYNVIARDNCIAFANWIRINNYTVKSGKGFNNNSKCTYVIDVDAENSLPIESLSETERDDKSLFREHIMLATWDIEVYSESGAFPSAYNIGDEITVIGVDFAWYWQTESIVRVILTTITEYQAVEVNMGLDNTVVLSYKCEKDMLLAFGRLIGQMQPEFMMGFNDGEFDYPYLIQRLNMYNSYCEWLEMAAMYYKEPWIPQTQIEKYSMSKNISVNQAKHTLQQESAIKFNTTKSNIKLEAGIGIMQTFPTITGTVIFDIRTIMRQREKGDKSSLRYYLEKLFPDNDALRKEDMPIQEMFAIIRNSKNNIYDKDKIADVLSYCATDATAVRWIANEIAVIADSRELATLAFVACAHALQFAGGMKVRNLVLAEASARGYSGSSINVRHADSGTYAGAMVLDPKTGIIKPKLTVFDRKAIATVDKYLSYNDVWASATDEDIQALADRYSTYHTLDTEFIETAVKDDDAVPVYLKDAYIDFLKEKPRYPEAGLDYASLYPSIIRAWNMSPEMVITKDHGWSIVAGKAKTFMEFAAQISTDTNLHRHVIKNNDTVLTAFTVSHNNRISMDDCPILAVQAKIERKIHKMERNQFEFGIVPSILDDFAGRRNVLKAKKKKLAAELEAVRAAGTDTDDIVDRKLQLSLIDVKQKAIKVFMNTFYGEMGNTLSSIFVLEIAAGVTMRGRYVLELAYKHVTDMGCVVNYGDTDSLYLSPPSNMFSDIEILYQSGKMSVLDYATNAVKITHTEMPKIRESTNKMLRDETGGGFLKLDYEEVLFPAQHLLKKKYIGLEHQESINFNVEMDGIFIRGLDSLKRGASKLMRSVVELVMVLLLDINEKRSPREIVESTIKQVSTSNISTEMLVQSKLNKVSGGKCISTEAVKVFIKRMADRGIIVPENERFNFIIVQPVCPFVFDIRGRRSPMKIGDKMELVSEATRLNLRPDMQYYLGQTINELALFISYDSDFTGPDPLDSARKYLDSLLETTPTSINKVAKMHNKIYEIAVEMYDSPTLSLITPDTEPENVANVIFATIHKLATKRFEIGKKYNNLYTSITASVQSIQSCNSKSAAVFVNTYFKSKSAANTKAILAQQVKDAKDAVAVLVPSLEIVQRKRLQVLTDTIDKMRTYYKPEKYIDGSTVPTIDKEECMKLFATETVKEINDIIDAHNYNQDAINDLINAYYTEMVFKYMENLAETDYKQITNKPTTVAVENFDISNVLFDI
jgi:DNA polymerase elongation subunit (family B)